MSEDAELLACYASEQSESAFSELIRRHVDLVYSAALRLVGGDTHRAEDVTQQVFAELARQAQRLTKHPALAGWLYTTTRRMALHTNRTQQRWQAREQEANSMNELLHNPATGPEWNDLRSVLDETMHDLGEKDRLAVLLRYFQNKSLKEVGSALGLSENAARMRVERALDKLRLQLTCKGVTSATAALALVLSNCAVSAAPPTFVTTLASTSFATAATATGTKLTLWKLMSMTKLKLGIIGAIVVGGITTPLVIQQQTAHAQGRQITLRVQNAPLAEVIRQIEQQSREKVPRDQNLSGTVTLDVKDSTLSDVLDALAPQVGARWSKVFAVHDSENALRKLEETFRGNSETAGAGWTNLAPQFGKIEFASAKPPSGRSFSTNYVIRGSGHSNSATGQGGGGARFTRHSDNGETTTVVSEGGSNGSMRVMSGPGGISASGPGSFKVVKSSSRGVTDTWSSERLVIETRLVPQLSGTIPEAATVETAAATAAKVRGRFATYHVLGKTPDGFMSFKRDTSSPMPDAARGSMVIMKNGQTNVVTQPEAITREIEQIQRGRAAGNLEKSPEQQVLDAREKQALQKKP